MWLDGSMERLSLVHGAMIPTWRPSSKGAEATLGENHLLSCMAMTVAPTHSALP